MTGKREGRVGYNRLGGYTLDDQDRRVGEFTVWLNLTEAASRAAHTHSLT